MDLFAVGDHVKIVSLGKEGIITDRTNSGTYKVQVGKLFLTCKESDLSKSTGKTPNKKRKSKAPPTVTIDASYSTSQASRPLDLHGITTNEAVIKLDHAIDSAVLHGQDRIEVIHGIGTGKVKEAVYRRLSELSVVKSFRIDEKNPGMTIVYL